MTLYIQIIGKLKICKLNAKSTLQIDEKSLSIWLVIQFLYNRVSFTMIIIIIWQNMYFWKSLFSTPTILRIWIHWWFAHSYLLPPPLSPTLMTTPFCYLIRYYHYYYYYILSGHSTQPTLLPRTHSVTPSFVWQFQWYSYSFVGSKQFLNTENNLYQLLFIQLIN